MRYAFRSVFKNPGFSAIAIGTLAVGIGLNVALFGIFNAMLFRPLPVHDPGRLVAILSASTTPDGPRGHLTYPDFEDLRARREVIADAFAFTQLPVGLSVGGQATRARGQIVTTNMFDVLGVRAAHGRTFADADDREQSAVISYDTWQRLFGADEAAVGRSVTINGRPFTIIGVTPRGFSGPDRFEPADLWIPLGAHQAVLPDGKDTLSRSNWWLTGIGRLAPGASARQAQSVLEGVASAIAAALPESHKGFTVRVADYHGTADDTRGQVAPIAALVMGVTLCVLLIACANVAGLLVSRAATRQREIGIRLAIGASRGALTRQFLGESLVLAAAAGTAGLIVAMWGTRSDRATGGDPHRGRIHAGLASAPLHRRRVARRRDHFRPRPCASRVEPATAAGAAVRTRIGRPPAQLAASARSGHRPAGDVAGHACVGRDPDPWSVGGVADRRWIRLRQPGRRRHRPEAAELRRSPRGRVLRAGCIRRSLPARGRARQLAHLVPFGGRVFVYGLSFPGRPADPNARPDRVSVNRVWTGFFATMAIPIVQGRDFTAGDLRPGADAAIVSETMARRFWPDGSALGQRFSIDAACGPFRTVVGVARDVQIDEFTERPWPAAWLPYDSEAGELVILAASTRPPSQVLREVEGVIRGLDRDLPVISSRPVRE